MQLGTPSIWNLPPLSSGYRPQLNRRVWDYGEPLLQNGDPNYRKMAMSSLDESLAIWTNLSMGP